MVMASNTKYRLDIQLLRGVSVLLVLFYHLKIPGFQNGFLGVDIFFVLSGYLMALLSDSSSPIEFYRRRFSRLLPAYLVVVFFTTLAVIIVSIPSDSNQRVDRLIYDLFALSNFSFWAEDSYFGSDSFKPLLNLWSLAVELQFYLLAPFVLPFLRKRKALLIFVVFVSLLGSMALVTISPKTSFFMLPTRFWEFLFGAFAAWHLSKIRRRGYSSFLILGAVFCLFSVLAVYPIPNDSNSPIYGHPSLAALIVVVSTTIFIGLGFESLIPEKSIISKFFVKIGDYSYSIYLTHFPIIVLVNYEEFEGTNLGFEGAFGFAKVLILTAISSYLLYNYVEKIRYSKHAIRTSLALFFVCLSLVFFAPKINLLNYDEEEIRVFNAWEDRAEYRCGKIVRILDPTNSVCILGSEFSEGKTLLLGNSHADSIKTIFQSAMSDVSSTTFFYVHNDPLMSEKHDDEALINEVLLNGISSVVVHYSPAFFDSSHYLESLKSFIQKLEMHDVRLFLIAPVPVYEFHVPRRMLEMLGDTSISYSGKTYPDYLSESASFFEFVVSNRDYIEGVSYPHEILCPKNKCLLGKDGAPYYFDSGHLTLTGAQALRPLFDDIALKLRE